MKCKEIEINWCMVDILAFYVGIFLFTNNVIFTFP